MRMEQSVLSGFSKAEGRIKMKGHAQAQSLKGDSGFSLIELLIVVLIIMILASLAVPSYLGARARANEASAVASVRVLMESQNLYRNVNGSYAQLNQLDRNYMEDTNIFMGRKSGYYFDTAPDIDSPRYAFTATAVPMVFIGKSATGKTGYFGDQTNVIRMKPSDDGNAPDGTSPALH